MRLGEGPQRAGAGTSEPAQAFEFRHHVFPIKRPHDLGRNGGQHVRRRPRPPGPGHVRPLRHPGPIAAQGGQVVFAGYHSAAGHYLVIRGAGSGEDYVYMHLRDAPPFHKGDAWQDRRPRSAAVGRDRPRGRLPPALRALDEARLVQRRQRLRPAPEAARVGRLVLSRP